MTVERIIFIQGSEADEFLDLLDEQGPESAILALSEWHYPGEHETADELGAGTADDTFEHAVDGGVYVLSWNSPLEYIGLEYVPCE